MTMNSNECESIIPEVEELREFHPDQFSNLMDIQEELYRLGANEGVSVEEVMSMSAVDDVNVVDHEVTIGENENVSILPEISDHELDEPMDQDEDISDDPLNDCSYNEILGGCLDVGETITISTPSIAEHNSCNQVGAQSISETSDNQLLPDITEKLPDDTQLMSSNSEFTHSNAQLLQIKTELVPDDSTLFADNTQLMSDDKQFTLCNSELSQSNSELSHSNTQFIQIRSLLMPDETSILPDNTQIISDSKPFTLSNPELSHSNAQLLQIRTELVSGDDNTCNTQLMSDNLPRNKQFVLSNSELPNSNNAQLLEIKEFLPVDTQLLPGTTQLMLSNPELSNSNAQLLQIKDLLPVDAQVLAGNTQLLQGNAQVLPGNTRPLSSSQLRPIRPMPKPEAIVTKNSPFISIGQQKKNVVTRVIYTTKNEVASDSPIILGDATGQPIRFIGQNKMINSRAITFAQAQEIGLLSPTKNNVKKGVLNKPLTMVRASPTKILPLPVSAQMQSPTLNTVSGAPQKLFIRQPGSLKTGTLIAGSPGIQTQILQIPMAQDNNNAQLHQIQFSGKQVQFLRLVSPTNTMPQLDTLTSSTVPSLTLATQPPQLNILPGSSTQNLNTFENMDSTDESQLNGKQSDNTLSNMIMKPLEIPSHLKPLPEQPSPPPASPPPEPQLSKPAQAPSPPAPKSKEVVTKDGTNQKSRSSDHPNGLRPRKPCNCTKSQCLKLYCDCFANGEFCFRCNCNCCFNNLEHEEERQRAIKTCLERNPSAFRPKIGKGYIGDERRHNKGCNCKRSGCLKNYCECYEAKIPCSNNCKCYGCRNIENSKELRHRISSESKLSQQLAVKKKLSSELQESVFKPSPYFSNQVTRQPFNLMTHEVVEATCQCLLAQVDGQGVLTENVEKVILEEFGRCLVEIIDCATRTSMTNLT